MKYIYILFFFLFSLIVSSQNSFNLSKNKSSKIRFQLINNIIIIPVQINGVELSFVLDTGVSRPILFNLIDIDTLNIKDTEKSRLRGLGSNGYINALKSRRNIIKIGNAISVNRDISVIFDKSINFTPRLGVPVHGIMGYSIFKDFVVEVNYSSKFIRLHKPKSFNYKNFSKWTSIPLELHNTKPYINISVKLNSRDEIQVKLLIDSGGSDALWLFENSKDGLNIPEELFFEDFLGKGLSGSVYGKRSKIESLRIGPYKLEKVNVAFPDSLSLNIARNYKERNGSISGNILKRFNAFYDYNSNKILLKKNNLFKSPFNYNNSGIVVEQLGYRTVKEELEKSSFDLYKSSSSQGTQSIKRKLNYGYVLRPAFTVVELRESSSAKASGIKIGDIITVINNRKTNKMTLQELNKFFYGKVGKTLRIKVDRNGDNLSFLFNLDNVFKKKSLQTEDSLTNN